MKNSVKPEVIGVASGKGGVGKTTVSVNLAVALAAKGKKVLLFDADLGLANAQIALGHRAEFNVSHVLSGQKTLQEIVTTTAHGVRLIPGGSGLLDMAALSGRESAAIVQAFSDIEDELDFLIVDIAAGISPQVMTFMRAVQRRLIVVRDEPSSIADAYGTIKVLCQEGIGDEVTLVPNMVDSQAAGEQLYRRIQDVSLRFLGQPLGYLGSIEADDMVLQSLRQHKPLVAGWPGSLASRNFRALAQELCELTPLEGSPGGLSFFIERQLA
ncbi:MAG: MinD/ParA family protein [Betaproteobacteria bacterium]|nr:MinD/ParA family protein [Betaproteobacteria bacterium]